MKSSGDAKSGLTGRIVRPDARSVINERYLALEITVVVVVRAVVVADRALVAGVTLVQGLRRGAHDKCRDDVYPDAHSREEHEEHGDQTNGRRIDAEVLGNTAAHAADFLVGSGFVKFFHSIILL